MVDLEAIIITINRKNSCVKLFKGKNGGKLKNIWHSLEGQIRRKIKMDIRKYINTRIKSAIIRKTGDGTSKKTTDWKTGRFVRESNETERIKRIDGKRALKKG